MGVFGSFHPRLDRLATTTTGLVSALSLSPRVEHVNVYVPFGSSLPSSIDPDRVTLVPVWEYDRPLTLLSTLLMLLTGAGREEVLLFNLLLTSFGKRQLSNGIGLSIPPILSLLTRRRVVCYLHHFMETQDIEKLGYAPGRLERFFIRRLEALLLGTCEVVVPLASQAGHIRSVFGTNVRSATLPYVEALALPALRPKPFTETPSSKRFAVMLFGAWGPQKDLTTPIRAVRRLAERGVEVQLLIAGSINSNFPDSESALMTELEILPKESYRLQLNVPDEELPDLFDRADVLVLPYRAAGGYSAVMNVAAFYNLPLIAFDLPELREFAQSIGARVTFVVPGNPSSLEMALVSHMGGVDKLTPPTDSDKSSLILKCVQATEDLLRV